MTSVPSSNIITVMLANYLTNNDPDKWLDMMNEKSLFTKLYIIILGNIPTIIH